MSLDSNAIDDLVRQALDRARSLHAAPQSTYRLQFHAGLTFKDAAAIVPYLAKLGVTHIYASPYFKARSKSTHGYDIVDHCRLNPDLGSDADFENLLITLREHGMSHICDMVPNHVGIGTNDNTWWNDVLEDGPNSIYAHYFDINWAGAPQSDLLGRVLVPILGGMFGAELEAGKFQFRFANDSFDICYQDRRFPVSPKTYASILSLCAQQITSDKKSNESCAALIRESESLADRCEGADELASRHERKIVLKLHLKQWITANNAAANAVQESLRFVNGVAGQPRSFDRLEDLLRRQCFRLAYWKTAPDEINYRRFFDINDLAALAMEHLDVFRATHTFVLELVASGKVAGLRIDHPDGLHDPRVYFQRLQSFYALAIARELFLKSNLHPEQTWKDMEPEILRGIERASREESTPNLYVVAEKILASDENLPNSWPIAGATGYQFLNMVNGLFVDSSQEREFDRIYRDWTGNQSSFKDTAYEKKKLILELNLASELNMLASELKRIAQADRNGVDFSLRGLTVALREIIACFPVYRTYISCQAPSETDLAYLQQAIDQAIARNPAIDPGIFRYIQNLLIGQPSPEISAHDLDAQRRFTGKFQQLSSPAAAKGIEDTAFYIYNRLLSLNEVGGDPARFGVTPGELHDYFQNRQRDWPLALSSLSTHDTKRSEDVRARINILSEIPREWEQALNRWGAMNDRHKAMVDSKPAPDRNEEYALYQTLLGAWPADSAQDDAFIKRIQAYVLKSSREAKIYTSWTTPHPSRERAADQFVHTLLAGVNAKEFRDDFQAFQRRISRLGAINSISQTLLKLTAPGVPDTYQGCELFDFSLVDPDNRRPVDYSRRISALNHATNFSDPNEIKILIHQKILNERKRFPTLFTSGQYEPLKIIGALAANVFAFSRGGAGHLAITVVPRLIAQFMAADETSSINPDIWRDTALILPDRMKGGIFRDVLSNREIRPGACFEPGTLPIKKLFSDLPGCLLISQ